MDTKDGGGKEISKSVITYRRCKYTRHSCEGKQRLQLNLVTGLV
jgi:hypothetical protein